MRWSSLPVESSSRGMTAEAGRIITAVAARYVATVQWSRALIYLEPRGRQMIKRKVIGAGVMGASVAYRLAQAGAAVTVLEATRIGGGTSGISFAWTNAHRKPPRPYHDLNVAGMKAHAALADEFGATPWWHGGGSLEWEAEPDRAAQADNIEQLQSWGYAVEWIPLQQAQELEPDVDPAAIGDAPVAFFPEEGWLDPVVYEIGR